MRVLAIFTCYNRKGKTLKAIETLVKGNPGTEIRFIAVDDGSSDGTAQALNKLNETGECDIEVINGTGNLFYSGGMRKGIERAKQIIYNNVSSSKRPDAVLLFNDDVDFYDGSLDYAMNNPLDRVYVGAMDDGLGHMTYGGARYRGGRLGIKYDTIGPNTPYRRCDTFNANFVVIPTGIFEVMPGIDPCYQHSMGDFDLGLELSHRGISIEVIDKYIGICRNNPISGTWEDTTLSIRERIKKKESPKGLPAKQWFHFLKKNFGLPQAIVHSITPYVKIVVGR